MFPLKVDLIRKLDRLPSDVKEVMLSLMEYFEALSKDMVRREDLSRLEAVVKKLAEAQLKSGERLSELGEAVNGLIESHRKAEARLTRLEEAIDRLAEAQRRSEVRLSKLEETVGALIEAQRKSEARLDKLEEAIDRLTEAQRESEQKIRELAEAQRRTEQEIEKLSRGLRNLREEVGGLARSFSYALENEAYRRLPDYLRERYGIEVLDRIIRFDLNGDEINLFARAKVNGEEVLLVGESVVKFAHAREIKLLERKMEKIGKVYGKRVIGIIVTHFAKAGLRKKAEDQGLIVVQSFEW